MNIKNILINQIKLNNAIIENNVVDKEKLLEKQLLALIVEISELANEIQQFKYWKKNIIIDDKKIIEEYADGIHFYLSFGLKLNILNVIDPIIFSEDMTIQFLEIFNSISIFSKNKTLNDFNYSFGLFIGLGKLLKYSDDEIEIAYLNKNKINFDRIKNKY